ncbi:uncharacterized protein HD556DRAFT_1443604 [Suillus plorans]|uniref:Uncharacterized protein n=1 Tax=Suillus plorans TaxID=116603 RepID=A0A9P7AP44_9AGAM|nr:uncharacterized protein HD556DRAFT_1443604 [Suillus plorans]KAG1793489.1 hypothetical protein HD556DRAFT_1443604 [Suillus plorans]
MYSSVSLPPTSEAPNSSPILKSSSFSLRASSPATPDKHISVLPPLTSKAPDSSPILKSCASSCWKTGFPVTPVKPRVSTVGSLSGTYEAPASSPILGSSSPISRSSPIVRGSSPTANASPLFTTILDEGNPILDNKSNSHKRPYEYSLLPDHDELVDRENFPMKKPKLLLTTFTCDQPCDTEIYFNQRMLELSRISRRTFAAKMEYQRLRAEELELITSLMRDEMEESQAHLKRADLQIGSLQNSLHNAGVAVIGNKGRKDAKESGYSRMFPSHDDHEVDDSREPYNSSVSSGCDGSVDGKQTAGEESYY